MSSKMKKSNRTKNNGYDSILLITTILLLTFGTVAVLSASYPIGVKDFNNGYYFVKKHIFFLLIGGVGMFITSHLKRSFVKKISKTLWFISLLLIFLLWTSFADSSYGQARWIKIPIIPFKIQPSDFIKVTSVLYASKVLSDNWHKLHEKEVFFKLFLIIALSAGPILTRDFSTGFVIAAELGAMYVVGGMYFYQFVMLGGITGAALVGLIATVPYRRKRIASFAASIFGKAHEKNPDDLYQINQALYAIAMGGTGGVGLFHSRQKYTNLPFAYNDFIYAIICEEFGAIGGILLIILFGVFVWRGFYIAQKTNNNFDKFTAVGLSTFIGIQAIFNIGVNIKLFPVTGITLPFISYGGTALIVSMAAAGLLLRISKDA